MQSSLKSIGISALTRGAAIHYGDATAFVCSSTGRVTTFKELDQRVDLVASALDDMGIRKGDVVACLLTNRIEIVELYFALARTGAVGLPLNYRLSQAELVDLTGAIPPKAIFYEERYAAAAAAIAAAGNCRRISIGGASAEGAAPDTGQAITAYETLLAGTRVREVDVPVDGSDPYCFGLTSGTTGLPKGYVLTHGNNTAMEALFQRLDMSGDDVVLTVFPMFGRVGLAWAICSVAYGIPNILANFDAERVLALIGRYKATIVNVVPTMAAMLLNARACAPGSTRSLRALVFAGASLPASIREEAARHLCPSIYEYYGMNEMGTLFLSNPSDRAARPESVGTLMSFAQAKIVDAEGNDVAPGIVGEVLGRSPMSAAGYHDNPEKSAETFRGGWVHTGDLGCLDADGYLFLRGRKKDMVISGGQNIYPAEVEATLLQFPGVADCAVIGLPDDFWGERLVAVVVPGDGNQLRRDALEAFCRERLAGFKVPKSYVFDVAVLPRNSTGKVQKFLLVEELSLRPQTVG